MLLQHGTEEQKQRFLPRMATGEVRGAFSMSEPGCGSDVAAIRTKAVRDGDDYVVNGQKMWLTNGGTVQPGRGAGARPTRARDVGLPEHDHASWSRRSRASARSRPGLTVPGKIEKMGYKGVDTTELVFDGYRIAGRPGPRRRDRAAASTR